MARMLTPRDWFGDGQVFVYDLPLACCALESQAAIQNPLLSRPPEGARVVVTLSGTITHAAAPAIRALVDALPSRPTVVAFGACASAGGPYWDSYSVVKGAEDLAIEVDHFIAGCPPPPGALTAVLETVRDG